MASTEPLLYSWQDEKAKPSLEDGNANHQLERRAKARNPSKLFGSVIFVLIALGIVRMIQVEIRYVLSNRKHSICTNHNVINQVMNFKDVRKSFHLIIYYS